MFRKPKLYKNKREINNIILLNKEKTICDAFQELSQMCTRNLNRPTNHLIPNCLSSINRLYNPINHKHLCNQTHSIPITYLFSRDRPNLQKRKTLNWNFFISHELLMKFAYFNTNWKKHISGKSKNVFINKSEFTYFKKKHVYKELKLKILKHFLNHQHLTFLNKKHFLLGMLYNLGNYSTSLHNKNLIFVKKKKESVLPFHLKLPDLLRKHLLYKNPNIFQTHTTHKFALNYSTNFIIPKEFLNATISFPKPKSSKSKVFLRTPIYITIDKIGYKLGQFLTTRKDKENSKKKK